MSGLQRGMKDATVPDPHLRFWLPPKAVGANGQGCFGMGYSMIALATKYFNDGKWKLDSFATSRTGMYWDTNYASGKGISGKFGYQNGDFRYEGSIAEGKAAKGGLNTQAHALVFDIDKNQRFHAELSGKDEKQWGELTKWKAAYKFKQPTFSTEVIFNGAMAGSCDTVDAYLLAEPDKAMMLGAYTAWSVQSKEHQYTDLAAMYCVPFGNAPITVRAGTCVTGKGFSWTKGLDFMVMPPAMDLGFKTHVLGRFRQGDQRVGEGSKKDLGVYAHMESVLPDVDAKVKVEYDINKSEPTVGLAAMWVKGGSAKKPGSWIVNVSVENIMGSKDGLKFGMRIIQGGTPAPL